MAGFFGFFDYTKGGGEGFIRMILLKVPSSLFSPFWDENSGKIVQINLMYILFSLPALLVSIVFGNTGLSMVVSRSDR